VAETCHQGEKHCHMSYKIEEIPGISLVYAENPGTAGIGTIAKLLKLY